MPSVVNAECHELALYAECRHAFIMLSAILQKVIAPLQLPSPFSPFNC
jgi:hypothetical protein